MDSFNEWGKGEFSSSDLCECCVLFPNECLLLGLGLDSMLLLYAVLQRPCRHHLALHAECSPLLHSIPLGHLNRAQI